MRRGMEIRRRLIPTLRWIKRLSQARESADSVNILTLRDCKCAQFGLIHRSEKVAGVITE